MSGGESSNYNDQDRGGGWTERSHWDSGTTEWRKDEGSGYTSWKDSSGTSGWERDRGNGWTERSDSEGNRAWGHDEGSGYTRWSDGTWTRDRS